MILMEPRLENVEAHKQLNQLLVIQNFKNNKIKMDNLKELRDHYLVVIIK